MTENVSFFMTTHCSEQNNFILIIANKLIHLIVSLALILTVGVNPTYAQQNKVGFHDPSSIIKDGNTYWIFASGFGIQSYASTDLVKWTARNTVFDQIKWPNWISQYVPDFKTDLSAPDCIYLNGKYYLYYSAASRQKNSCIGLATSVSLNNPKWIDEGVIASSKSGNDFNAIHPAVFMDAKGKLWLTYGSKGTGIKILELNPSTGKPLNTKITSLYTHPEAENAKIIKNGSYYYLFVNKGDCCEGTESSAYVEVARSADPTGPFTEWKTVLNSSGSFVGPGSIGYYAESGTEYATCHYYDADNKGAPTLSIGKFTWSNGWPAISSNWVRNGTYAVKNVDNNLVWDNWGCTGAAGQTIAQTYWNNSICQKWDFTHVGNGVYRITCNQGGLAFDAAGCGSGTGAKFQLWESLNNICQQWRIERTNDKKLVISAKNGGRVIESPAGFNMSTVQIQLADYNGNNFQKWTMITASSENVTEDAEVYPVIAADTVRLPLRLKPTAACILENKDLRITFDKTDGLPYKYELINLQDSYWGEDLGRKIEATVRRLADKSEEKSKAILSSTAITPGLARFKYKLVFNGSDAGSFEIHYALKKTSVIVTLENVLEAPGYHLIELMTENLVTIRQEDGPSSFVYNKPSGKLVDLAKAKPGDIGYDEGFFGGYPNISILPIVAFVKPKSVCVVEIKGLCSKTILDVKNNGGNNRAKIGASVLHYQRGGINTPDLIIKQNNICRMDFAGDYDGRGKVDWLDAAKMARDNMPPVSTHFFDDKYMWIIHGQVGRHDPENSFDDIKKVVKRISALTDNSPQICYISGWCEGGHDTGYPNITKINSLLGGEAAFTKLREEGKKLYNATVSFDDNYDDQYDNEYTKGYFSLDNIAKTVDGNPVTFYAWNGKDVSHITGMAHYMRPGGPGEARVDHTATKYGIENTELIDAATWWTIRADYDPRHPASAPTNFLEGKVKLFERFQKKYGINIVSELLRYGAIGHVAMVCDGPSTSGGSQYGDAGERVPFLSIALRKSIYYGGTPGNQAANKTWDLLYNNSPRHGWLSSHDSSSFITDIYYTNFIPWFKMHDLDVLSFVQNGKIIDMELSKNSSIHLSPESVIAKYQGNVILNNEDITCPMDDRRIAFYGRSGKVLSYPLPSGIVASALKAEALYEDHRVDVPVTIEDGQIKVNVPKRVPVIVYLKKQE